MRVWSSRGRFEIKCGTKNPDGYKMVFDHDSGAFRVGFLHVGGFEDSMEGNHYDVCPDKWYVEFYLALLSFEPNKTVLHIDCNRTCFWLKSYSRPRQ